MATSFWTHHFALSVICRSVAVTRTFFLPSKS
jgi:hypothetical protein